MKNLRLILAIALSVLIGIPSSAQMLLTGVGSSGGAASPSTPTWARVQGTINTSGSGTSVSVALPSAITSGDIAVGGILLNADAILTNVTDDKGNAYRIVNSAHQPAGGLLSVAGYRSIGPVTNGAQTLTFTYQSSSLAWVVIDEFTAGFPLSAASLDGSQLAVNSPASSTISYQTLQNNDLLYFAGFDTNVVTTGAGWTAGQGSGTQQMSQWKQSATASGSTSAVFGNTGSIWATTFGVNASPRTGWELRQNQSQRTANGVNTGSVSFGLPVAPGDIVIFSLAVGTDGNVSDIIGCTDDKLNVYQQIPNSINASGRVMYWSGGALTNEPTTITCTTTVVETVVYFMANEFIPPVGKSTFAIDGTPVMTNPTTTGPWSSSTITTTNNGDLVYSFIDNADAGSLSANGFSTLNNPGETWTDAFLIQKTAGAISAQWNGSGSTLNALGAMAISAN
jgi:hypothetical protein